ncbi:MAG TPA: T9SS type A sorting domain-containing protein [Candidatus Kapabacteria bacterium]|nr:T9SS type A sorting domain-containing protein [Candidatus Kapabacteria bacterium]
MVKSLPKLKYLFALLLFVFLLPFTSMSQPEVWDLHDDPEFFGTLKTPNSNIVKTSYYDSYDYIYAGIWGKGIYKSSNFGKTWLEQNVGLSNLYITSIVEAENGNIVVSTMGGGIYISEDRAKNWKESNSGLNHKNVRTLIRHSNNWLILGTYGGGVYISKDDGKTWNQSIQGLYYRDISALTYSNNGFIIAGTQGGGIYASRDTGRTWKIQNTGLKNYFINQFVRDNNGLIYAATNGRGIFNSGNDGLTWTELDTFMTRPYTDTKSSLPDLNVTTMSLNKKNQIIFGTRYGGIFYYDDVEDFSWIPTNIRGTGINELLNDKKGNNWAFANAMQPQYTETFGEQWKQLDDIIKPLNPKLFILGKGNLLMFDDNGSINLSSDDGKTWNNTASLGFAINSIARDSSGALYAASNSGIHRSLDAGKTWSMIKFKDTVVSDVEIAPNGYIWLTAVHSTEPNPPSEPIVTKLVVNSSDGGTSWNNVTMDLSKIKQTPKKIGITLDNTVYIGLQNAFYYTRDNGANWKLSDPLGGNSNEILDITIDKSGRVFAATYFGIWANTSYSKFDLISLFLSYNYLVHVDRNGVIYGCGNYQLPNNFAYINLSYRSLDTGKSFKVLNNSYNSDILTSIASDDDGDVYFTTASGELIKSVAPATMKIPEIVNLKDKEQDVPNQVELNWKSTEEAELYQIQISTDEDFIFKFEFVTTSDTNYFVQSNFEPYTKYYWRVRSKNHAALSDWTTTRTFVSKIGAPKLKSPDSNALGIPVLTKLEWFSVSDANKYDVILSKSSDFKDTIFQKYDYADTTISVPLLEGLTTYYWKVRAKNKFTSSYWSNYWNFKTVLGPPLLASPTNNSNGNNIDLQMTWHPAIDANSYKLIIAEDANFTINIKEYDAQDTSYNITGLEYDKYYWWKVASVNQEGQSVFSLTWKFKTAYSPLALISPENKKVNNKIPVNLVWSKHEYVNNYHLQVASDSNFIKIVKDTNNLLDLTQLAVSGLNYFSEYYWRARVENDSNIGVWSSTFSFKTTLNRVGLRSPANNSLDLPTDLTFLWFSLPGATQYHLQIARDSIFEDLYYSQDTISNFSTLINELPNKTKLFWRVRGVNQDGYGEWSEVWKFSTSGNSPSLIAPKNGAENVKLPIKFQWSSFGEAESYNIQVSNNKDFSNLVSSQDNIVQNQYSINDFIVEPNTEYFWRVIANMSNGQSNWSQVWSFITDPILDIEDNTINTNFATSPNPAVNSANIEFNLQSTHNIKLEIMDMSGRILLRENLNNLNIGKNIININTKEYSNGVYFVKIYNDKEYISGEFIISR